MTRQKAFETAMGMSGYAGSRAQAEDSKERKAKAKQETPRTVVYEGKRCRVLTVALEDGKPMYNLQRGVAAHAKFEWVWAADCSPVTKGTRTGLRKLRHDDVVLEFDARGQVFLRRKGSRRRYPTSLRALYDSTVKQAVIAERFAKKMAKRNGKA